MMRTYARCVPLIGRSQVLRSSCVLPSYLSGATGAIVSSTSSTAATAAVMAVVPLTGVAPAVHARHIHHNSGWYGCSNINKLALTRAAAAIGTRASSFGWSSLLSLSHQQSYNRCLSTNATNVTPSTNAGGASSATNVAANSVTNVNDPPLHPGNCNTFISISISYHII